MTTFPRNRIQVNPADLGDGHLDAEAERDAEWPALDWSFGAWQGAEDRGMAAEAARAWALFEELDRRVYTRAAARLRAALDEGVRRLVDWLVDGVLAAREREGAL